jgi:hypothetical protein
MAIILAFDVVARFNCADFYNGQAGRERRKRDRRAGRFASTEVAARTLSPNG